MQRYESLRYEWHNYIAEDIEELELLRSYISNLVSPFGFLRQMAEEKVHELSKQDKEDHMQQSTGGNSKFH